MKSLSLMPELYKLPKTKIKLDTYVQVIEELDIRKHQDMFIEGTILSSLIGYQLLNTRNIPDELFEAYSSSFPESGQLLYRHYLEIQERGGNSVIGFVNNMKGKYFEYYIQDNLKEQYPNYNFEIATNPTQPIWDIKGINDNGDVILIQAKMWSAVKSNQLTKIIEGNQDVLYATSKEIRIKIIEKNPDLADRFIPIDISNIQFTEDVKDALEILQENLGLDLPDEVFLLIPFSTEIVLGLRAVADIVSVNRDFKDVELDDIARLAGVKVLVLISRFGASTILSIGGGAVGTGVAPGIGTFIGGAVGYITAGEINKRIAPRSLELAYKLLGIDSEDLVYFKNKRKINFLGLSLRKSAGRVTLDA